MGRHVHLIPSRAMTQNKAIGGEQNPCVGLSGQRRRGFPGFHFLEKSLTIHLVRRRAYLNAVEPVR